MKNDILNIKIVSIEKGFYIVNYKQGQRELLTILAEKIGITLDELISRKIAEVTGERICVSPVYRSMPKK